MSKIPPGVNPAEWFAHRVNRRWVPQAVVRIVAAAAIAYLVSNPVVRIVMALSVTVDTGLIIWARLQVRRLRAQSQPGTAGAAKAQGGSRHG